MSTKAMIISVLARNGVYELWTADKIIRDRRRKAIAEQIISGFPAPDYDGLRLAILDILEAKLGRGNGEFEEIATEVIDWIKDSTPPASRRGGEE